MENIAKRIKPILLKYGVQKASLFGSYGKGNFDRKSDVDILFAPPKNMGIQYVELKQELEDLLQKKVDLVSMDTIDIRLKKSIMLSEQPIL